MNSVLETIVLPAVRALSEVAEGKANATADEVNAASAMLRKAEEAKAEIGAARVRLSTSVDFQVLSTAVASCKHYVVPSAILAELGGYACTDGTSIAYGSDFISEVAKLSPKAVNFVVAHEAVHVAFCHSWLHAPLREASDKKRQEMYPVAVDVFVQNFLHQIDPTRQIVDWSMLVKNYGVVDMRADLIGKSVPEILSVLLVEAQQQEDADGDANEGNSKDGNSEGDKEGKGNGEGNEGGKPSKPKTHDAHTGPAGDSVQDQNARKEFVKNAVQQAVQAQRVARQMQKQGGQGREQVEATDMLIEALAPKADWRDLLEMEMTASFSTGADLTVWPANHRLFDMGLYLPSVCANQAPGLLIQLDMSTSCTEMLERLASELEELVNQFQPSHVTILYTTTSVVKVEHFTREDGYCNFVQKMKPMGSGGTELDAGFEWHDNPFSRNVEHQDLEYGMMLTFTDCEYSWGQGPQRNGVRHVTVTEYTEMHAVEFPSFGQVIDLTKF